MKSHLFKAGLLALIVLLEILGVVKISFAWIFFLLEVLAVVSAAHAVLAVRTSQAAIAWALLLVTFPILTLPLYWIFGRNKFSGYVEALAQGQEETARRMDPVITRLKTEYRAGGGGDHCVHLEFENLNGGYPFLQGNAVELLIDGEATFSRMFGDIDSARDYVLLQYYIVNDDGLGRELKSRLIDAAKRGVRVYFLYDEIGSHSLPGSYVETLQAAGVKMHPFGTTQGRGNRFQLNFRNHRKITVVDGSVGYVGGHNVGEEYLGNDPKFGAWRDTHTRIDGPAVRHVQVSFLADWYYATREAVALSWEGVVCHENGTDLLILPTGPADPTDTCSMMFVMALNMARERIWIASPYFIPNEAVIEAMHIAALRGVDVRVMLPLKPDHRIVYLAGFHFMAALKHENIHFLRYAPGFLHEKAFVVDNRLAMVGTANADNRSFKLNFEISALSTTPAFVGEVAGMFERDFLHCREVAADEGYTKGFPFQLGVRLARLFSPIL